MAYSRMQRVALRYLLSRKPIPNVLGKFRMLVEGDELGAVAGDILAGIERSADLCRISPPACTGNMGIPRAKMPQFRSQYQEDFVKSLEVQGISTNRTRITAGMLKATQRELNARTIIEMTVRYKIGELASLFVRPVLVSRKNFILDGHHRWATILTLNPSAKVPVVQIDATIHELLEIAHRSPLVQYSGFND